MPFLYHAVPEGMAGTVLYPLNVLKAKMPDVFDVQAKKYAGREFVMEYRIPILDCLWNDVLHFAAVHPRDVKKALMDAGRKEAIEQRYFEIDPHALDPASTVVYLYPDREKSPSDFVPYDPERVAEYSKLPDATASYYADKIAKGERPLLYVRVPHILFKGSLETSGIRVISV